MPLYIDSNYVGKNYPFPRHEINPKDKDKDWCLAACKSIYANYSSRRTNFDKNWYDKVVELRRYAEGRQDPEKYISQIIGPKERNQSGEYERKGYTDINFKDIFSPAPKYLEVIQGMFESNEHTITVNAEDENSGTEKQNAKMSAWFKAEYAPFIEMMDEQLGITRPPENFMPQSRQELELFADMGGFKLRYEVAMEKALSHTYHISNWKQIKRKLVYDFVVNNMAATMDIVDVHDQKVKLEYIDFSELIMEYSRDWDFKKSRWGALPQLETIEDLRTSGCGIPEDQLKGLAQKYRGQYDNPNVESWAIDQVKRPDGTYGYDSYRIPVMYAAWKSYNGKYVTETTTNQGRTIKRQTEFGKIYDDDKKKTSKVDIRVIYHAKWIVGTDYIFDYGLMNDIPRDKNDVRLPFHVYRIPGKSIIEQMIPMLDDLQLTFLKLQNNKAKVAPPGLIVEIGSLENVSLGTNKMKPLDLIRIYQQGGTMFYRANTLGSISPAFNNGPPITPHNGSMMGAIDEAIKSFEYSLQSIAELTGIARNATGTIDPNAQVGTSHMAVAATNDALRPIYAGYIDIKESCAINAALRIQLICKYEKSTTRGYYPVIGKASMEALSTAGSKSPVQYGIRIEALPTEETKREIKEAARAGLAGGKNGIPALTWGDYLYIVEKLNSGSYFTEMRAFIAYKEADREKRESEKEQANIQMLQEESRKTEEVKTQMELMKIQTEFDLKAKLIMLQGEEDRKTIELEKRLEMQGNSAKMMIESGLGNLQQQEQSNNFG